MNITTTFGSTALRKPNTSGLASWWALARRQWAQRLLRTPLLWWSLVVAAALLAFFVHLLNEQVLRGEMLREEQRAAANRPSQGAGRYATAQHPVNLLVSTRQPMTRP